MTDTLRSVAYTYYIYHEYSFIFNLQLLQIILPDIVSFSQCIGLLILVSCTTLDIYDYKHANVYESIKNINININVSWMHYIT